MSEEIEVRDQRLVGYYWIESTILKKYGKELGPYGIAVYNALACQCDNNTSETYLSAATIAEMTGMSEKQAYRELAKIRKLGLVDYEPRPGRSTLYTLITIEKNPKKVKKQKAKTGW